MIKNISNYLVKKPRGIKRLVVALNDGIINISSFILISILITGSFTVDRYFILFQATTIITFFLFNIYDNVIKHIGTNYIYRLILSLLIPHILYLLVAFFFLSIPLLTTVLFVNFFVVFSFLYISRMIAKSFLYRMDHIKESIAIYVDESYSSTIIDSISPLGQYDIVALINHDKNNRGLFISGIKVYHISDLKDLIRKKKLKKLFIASEKNIIELKNTILEELSNSPLKIIEIPNVDDILKGKYSFDSLKNLSIEDVIDRPTYQLGIGQENKDTLIQSKNILVTGAGGSIGSVLSSQLLSYNPEKIILLDHSEAALFKISKKIERMNSKINVISKLVDLSDKDLLRDVFKNHRIDMVYHAAAYKHVDMLERNIISAVKNNVIGLYNLLYECKNNHVQNFVLISTDKAVNPTTFMGLTKRFCELMLFNSDQNSECHYSAVRFGNVFNSSGSVIPIFKKQIENQNYLTVTDENVTRYFMSIDEAVHLVLKASIISNGGEMFILDMGEPKKIIDIAKKMIHLSGNIIKSDDNPDGDIEIKIIGLGKSEKMHEELSESKVQPTSEDKILKSSDSECKINNLDEKISSLLDLIQQNNSTEIKNYLKNQCLQHSKIGL